MKLRQSITWIIFTALIGTVSFLYFKHFPFKSQNIFMQNVIASENEGDFIDRVIESLAELEGFESGADINPSEVTEVVSKLFSTNGQEPSFKYLIEEANKIEDETVKSTLIILSIMALTLEADENFAFSKFKSHQSQIKLTYMDDEPRASNELLPFCYAWLINNVMHEVPRSLITQNPDLFAKHTPHWGATRDAYFSVTLPQNHPISSSESYKKWYQTIREIDNPSGGFRGSLWFYRDKSYVISAGLLAYNPDYYLKNFKGTNSPKWSDLWRYLGEYENQKVTNLIESRKLIKPELVKYLMDNDGFHPLEAELMANTFIESTEQLYMRVSRDGGLEKNTNELLHTVDAKGWRVAVAYIDKFDSKYLFLQLRIIAGYLLSKNQIDEFADFFVWAQNSGFEKLAKPLLLRDEYAEYHIDKNSYNVFMQDLVNHAASSNPKALIRVTPYFNQSIKHWGNFNKTPLMYAVQYNQTESYKHLKNVEWANSKAHTDSNLPNDEIVNSGDVPKIDKRNVLTYALENSLVHLIEEVIKDFGGLFAAQVDSEDRNVFYYLSQNLDLTNSERSSVSKRLAENYDVPIYEASFDCKLARSSIELLTCGIIQNANLDRQLSRVFFKCLDSVEDIKKKNEMVVKQRKWLANRMECIQENGFNMCYQERMSDLNTCLVDN